MKPGFWNFDAVASLMAFMLVTIGGCNSEKEKQPTGDVLQGDTNQVRIPEAALQKTPDDKPTPPVDLGRSSITQAEEPALRSPDLHGWDPLGADCAWFREFKRDISAEDADPNSDRMLQRLVKGKGHIDAQWSGSWTPADWHWYTIPFQVVSDKTVPLSIPGTWAYNPASNGPYLLPPEPVVHENSQNTKYATAKWTKGGDHHLIIYVLADQGPDHPGCR